MSKKAYHTKNAMVKELWRYAYAIMSYESFTNSKIRKIDQTVKINDTHLFENQFLAKMERAYRI